MTGQPKSCPNFGKFLSGGDGLGTGTRLGRIPYSMLVYKWWRKMGMPGARKITVEVPAAPMSKAQKASDTRITQTVRTGLIWLR